MIFFCDTSSELRDEKSFQLSVVLITTNKRCVGGCVYTSAKRRWGGERRECVGKTARVNPICVRRGRVEEGVYSKHAMHGAAVTDYE